MAPRLRLPRHAWLSARPPAGPPRGSRPSPFSGLHILSHMLGGVGVNVLLTFLLCGADVTRPRDGTVCLDSSQCRRFVGDAGFQVHVNREIGEAARADPGRAGPRGPHPALLSSCWSTSPDAGFLHLILCGGRGWTSLLGPRRRCLLLPSLWPLSWGAAAPDRRVLGRGPRRGAGDGDLSGFLLGVGSSVLWKQHLAAACGVAPVKTQRVEGAHLPVTVAASVRQEPLAPRLRGSGSDGCLLPR